MDSLLSHSNSLFLQLLDVFHDSSLFTYTTAKATTTSRCSTYWARGHNFIEHRFHLSTVSALGLSPYSLDPIHTYGLFYILHAVAPYVHARSLWHL